MILLGEGTFHQVHGGIATNVSRAELATRYLALARAVRGASRVPVRAPDEPAPLRRHLRRKHCASSATS